MPEYALVVGPGVRFDRRWLAHSLEALAGARGMTLEFHEPELEEQAADLLAAVGDQADGIVLDPGVLDPTALRLVELPVPVVQADLHRHHERVTVPDGIARRISGRGADTYRWALRHLHARVTSSLAEHRYGPDDEHRADLHLPPHGAKSRHPVAVLLHGGFWMEQWQRDLMDDMAIDLACEGIAAWNLEYRRVGPSGGGVPQTLEDVVQGLAHLETCADEASLDLDRIVVVGHSAGGQLALWLAASERLGYGGRVTGGIRGVVSLAGLPDLAESARRGQGDGCVTDFVGGLPSEVVEQYELSSPIAHLPLGVPTITFQGLVDDANLVDLNRLYVAAAKEVGDRAMLHEFADADHFHLIDPSSAVWPQVRKAIEEVVA